MSGSAVPAACRRRRDRPSRAGGIRHDMACALPPSGGGDAVSTAGAKGDVGHLRFPMSPLDTPLTFRWPLSEAFAAKRGRRGLGSVRRAAYGTLVRPEVTLRELPRISVRGQTVQSACFALRKAPLPSSVDPWSTKRPCGPLAFRRATGGSRVQRRVWGVKRGKGTIGALSPLVSAARRRQCHAMSWRTSPRPGGPVSPPPAAPLYRRGGKRSAGQRLQ